jgi:hypothetical protein
MSRQALSLFRKLCEVIALRRPAVTSIIGGLALGLSALAGMLQSPRPLDTHIEIQRKELHGRVQRVRNALHTTEGTLLDGVRSSHLVQWYNWGKGPKKPDEPWNKYRK